MNEQRQPRVIYPSEYPDEERFTNWIRGYHGSNLVAPYQTRKEEKLKQGLDVVALDIVDELNRETRQVDISKQGFQARFR